MMIEGSGSGSITLTCGSSGSGSESATLASGFLFFAGWWFAIDASASDYANTRDVFHLCGVFSAISMFMVNSVSNEQLRGEGLTDGVCGNGVGPKIWFFFAFLMGFG
jgi:hypothetical protein